MINSIQPDLINESKLSKKSFNMYETLQLHDQAIEGAKALGCHVINIGGKDLYDKNVSFIVIILSLYTN